MSTTEKAALKRWREYLESRTSTYSPGMDAKVLRDVARAVTEPSDEYLRCVLDAYTDKYPFASGAVLRSLIMAAGRR